MGLTDELVEGEFTWIDTDTPPTEFTDWFPGEPNGRHNEDCALFWEIRGFFWNDGICSLKLQAVCELQ